MQLRVKLLDRNTQSSYETCHLFCDVPPLISMVPVVVRTKIFSEKADRCLSETVSLLHYVTIYGGNYAMEKYDKLHSKT